MNEELKQVEQQSFSDVHWEDLREPGAYLDTKTGDIYRIPKEALMGVQFKLAILIRQGELDRVPKEALSQGGSLIIEKPSAGASKLVRISKDPFISTIRVRKLCAQHNIKSDL
ncbi:MAG: hypothetical protein HY695_17195 [Deltaproteobacteria bacterium]|nr:hypothetical protein [Deltaproteobacteria bacterium]